jgi:hypothetical protein
VPVETQCKAGVVAGASQQIVTPESCVIAVRISLGRASDASVGYSPVLSALPPVNFEAYH